MEATQETGNLTGIRQIILVLSGKGGVGKSTVSTELALALRHSGKKVGILDVDLCGPSIPRMLKVQDKAVHQCDNGWVPVFVDQEQTISLMSVGFLLEKPDEAVVWRGPKKNALIKQFVSDVAWGDLDYLIVDTPPGTSDEHISAVEALRPYKPLGAILVTTPQADKGGADEEKHPTRNLLIFLKMKSCYSVVSFAFLYCKVEESELDKQGQLNCGQPSNLASSYISVPNTSK
ncbi:cytosolic Fe-S cluster assembly factor NUBP2 isoform X3 [Petaurus breviceps papuanus]|uniref:cytosolic Fe-S cluster assembly factor NUBP2 isoform X3 n=1 Tax=Petaurus breviceps papuanus TaxID=3040969 RepID=UPI0036DB9FA5